MKFRIKDCRVSVSFYFFAFACAAAFFDKSGTVLHGLIFALLHELGHLTAMLLLPGQTPRSVCLTPFGIRITRRPSAEFARGGIIVLAAGSAINLFLAALLWNFNQRAAAMNFILGVTNLLPVESLDGGGILKLLLVRTVDRQTENIITSAISLIVLTIMAFAGVYVLFRTKYNFTLLGMALWLLTSLLLRLMKKEE